MDLGNGHMFYLWQVGRGPLEILTDSCGAGAATGAMGQPTPPPPADLTEDEMLSYIDPGYEVLEKVCAKYST